MAVTMLFVTFPFYSQCLTLSLAHGRCARNICCWLNLFMNLKSVNYPEHWWERMWAWMLKTLLGVEGSRKPGWSADHKQHPPSPSDLSLVPFGIPASSPFLFTDASLFAQFYLRVFIYRVSGKKGFDQCANKAKMTPYGSTNNFFFPERLGWMRIYIFSWEHLDNPLVLLPTSEGSGRHQD